MKKSKKLIAMLLTLMMLLSILPAAAFAEVNGTGTKEDPWQIGLTEQDNVTAYLENGTLTIGGTGAMQDFSTLSIRPWHNNRGDITTVVINSGVTGIGKNAFSGFSKLTSVTIPASVKKIGVTAFNSCSAEKTLYIDSLKSWCVITVGSSGYPSNIKTLYVNGKEMSDKLVIPENIEDIPRFAFSEFAFLKSVTIPETVESIGDSAFDSDALETIVLKAEKKLPSFGSMVFGNPSKMTATIYVPAGLLETYELAANFTAYCTKGRVKEAYMVNVAPATNGTVTVDKDFCTEADEIVTVTATPAEGYQLKSLVYNDGTSDTAITATEGVYSFAMPTKNVTVKAEFEELPSHTHEVNLNNMTAAKAATCTEDGYANDWYACTDPECTAMLDIDGNEITDNIIPAKGHTYGDPVAVWTGDICTATRTCTVLGCEDSISETKQGTFVQDTAATCTEAAKGHYAVTFEDEQFGSAQTAANSVTNGDPIEHSYTGEYVQNEEHTKHAQLCVNGCGQPGEFTDCTGGEATCQKKAVCETCLKEYGELAGHSFTNYVYNNDASCTKAGTKTAKCDNCEATDTIDDLEHPQLEHSYTGEFRANNDGTHSFKCVNGCGEYGGTVECVDELGDGYCDICGATLDPLAQDRADAIAKLEAIVNGNTNEKVQSMLAGYVAEINNASSLNEINSIVAKATSALKQQIEIANEGSLVSAIRALVNLCDNNHQKTTNKVMSIIKPILGLFGIR